MKISKLIKNIDILKIKRNTDIDISSINFDSRKTKKGSLFIAVRGTNNDGNLFIKDAIKNGAVAVIYDSNIKNFDENTTYIKVRDSHIALAEIASNFYENPSRKLELVGVTGTNGKTTVATLLYKLFLSLDHKTALISTIENKINKKTLPTTHTTPDPITLNKLLAEAVKKGCKYAFMECSSHAIDQKRIHGLEFAGCIFTNLTHDHLDYHKTLQKYAETKKKLFDFLPEKSFAIANADDKKHQFMLKDTKARKYTYSIKKDSDYFGKVINKSMDGSTILINGKKIETKLIGDFNTHNILAIFATAKILKITESKIITNISKLNPPKGRLEFIKSKRGIYGVVDYAHTPDALEKILITIKSIGGNHKIITVIGCGGDRDKTKRPIMARIACKMSDFSIFTSDNPRSEKPEKIIKDMILGLTDNKKFQCIIDRKKAIISACKKATSGDIVLVAGKGHENYQIFKDKTVFFSDLDNLNKILIP